MASMNETTDEDWARRVAEEDWARRIQQLSTEEREQRAGLVDALLARPEDLCDGLETELYILRAVLRTRLAGPAGETGTGMPDATGPATLGEQLAVAAAGAEQERCLCGDCHDDGTGIPPSVAGRMRAYLAAHPGQHFAADEEGETVAVIIPRGLEDPEVIASADSLTELLDSVGAPSAAELS
jgi:cytochrome c553